MNRDRQVASTGHPITFPLYSSTDHITLSTGVVPQVKIAKDGSNAWSAASGSVSEMGNGWYAYAGHVWDRDTLGELSILASGAGTDTYTGLYSIVPFNPYDSVRLGLTALPGAIAGSSTGLPLQNQLATISGIWGYSPRTSTIESGDYAYYADVKFTKNGVALRDEYTVDWFKNTQPVGSSSITSPTIQVFKRTDGSSLIAQHSMNFISTNLGTLKYDETVNLAGSGDAYIVQVSASIDGSTRTWNKLVSRDS